MMEGWSISIINGFLTLLTTFVGIFCAYMVFGTTTWLVNQIFAFPLRPVLVRPALSATRKNWKRLVVTGTLTSLLSFIGYILCFFPGIYLSVIWNLVAPVVMMEGLSGRAAMKRSKLLVKRSLRTTIAAVFIMFLVPFLVASSIGFFAATTVKSFSDTNEQIAELQRKAQREAARQAKKAEAQNKNEQKTVDEEQQATKDDESSNEKSDEPKGDEPKNNNENNVTINNKNDEDKMSRRIKEVTRDGLTSLLMLPFQLLIAPLSSIIVALLYLKTRQAGGEPIQDLLGELEEKDKPQSNWQKRVRERLQQSGRVTSKS
jgi:hypothetical protein